MSMNEYKCPNCGGAITFDSTSQMMKCPYCDAEFDVETLRAMDEDLSRTAASAMDWDLASGEWQPGEQDGLGVFACQSCGGEIVADENLGSTACPYCGSPVVLTSRFSGTLRPDLVIPFKMDKNAAKDSLKRLYMGKRLLPKVFKDENHLDEIKGMYVPFWLFSAEADADIHYRGTRTNSWKSGQYRHTETSYFDIYRGGCIGFDYVPEDGASKINDTMMESVEPFYWNEAVDFQTAYLAGFIADKYDVEADHCRNRANERIVNSTEEAFRSTVTGFATVSIQNRSIRLRDASVRYALLPIWFLNTSFKGSKYSFAMNGQTGKFVGDLPLDTGLFVKWLLGIFLAVALLLNLILIPATVFGEESLPPETSQEESLRADVITADDAQADQLGLPRLVDEMDLLTDEEEAALIAKLDRISLAYNCDVAIADIWSLNDPLAGTEYMGGYGSQDYADAWLWYGGFGIGENRDAIVFLLAMENRDYAISTYGYGITAFTDAGMEYMMDDILDDLANDDYYNGFDTFADYADDFLNKARNGSAYDTDNLPASLFDRLMMHFLATFIAFIIALVVVLVWRSKLKSIKPNPFAREYVRRGSMNVARGHERFMYKTVSVVKIESSSGSSGSSRGGSRTHSSSFGGSRSFGGRSGKF
jgi:uncharacterized membrane protein YgcG/DNA-directed RNA polymerase subunit RPC12/RpoP